MSSRAPARFSASPSVIVLEAVGMRREGHMVESTWAKGEWTDDLLFATLRRERS